MKKYALALVIALALIVLPLAHARMMIQPIGVPENSSMLAKGNYTNPDLYQTGKYVANGSAGTGSTNSTANLTVNETNSTNRTDIVVGIPENPTLNKTDINGPPENPTTAPGKNRYFRWKKPVQGYPKGINSRLEKQYVENLRKRIKGRIGIYRLEKAQLLRMAIQHRNRTALLNKTIDVFEIYVGRMEQKIENSTMPDDMKANALSEINESYLLIADARTVLSSNETLRAKISMIKEDLYSARLHVKKAISIYASYRIKLAIERLDKAIDVLNKNIEEMKSQGKDTTALEYAVSVLENKKAQLEQSLSMFEEGEAESGIKALRNFRVSKLNIREIGRLSADGNGTARIHMIAGRVVIAGRGKGKVENGNVKADGFDISDGTFSGNGKIYVTGRNFTVSFDGAGSITASGVGKAFIKGSGKYTFKGVRGYWNRKGETLVFEGGGE